jgi:hypothetical protein
MQFNFTLERRRKWNLTVWKIALIATEPGRVGIGKILGGFL